MRSRIKTLFFCLSAFRRERHGVLGFALLAALPLAAQPQQVHPNPDCQFFFTLTAANQFQPTGSGFDNRQQGCTTWSMSYVNSGFSGLTVTLQSAANNNGVAGTFGAGFPIQETTISGSNAATNTTGGFWWVQGTNAWVNVKLSGTTGSGTVQGAVFGWRIPNAGGGSGAGSIVCLTGDVAAGSGGSCTTATVQGIESVPFCSGYTPANGQFVEYTTGGSPNPCYSAAAGGGGGGGTGNAASIVTYTPSASVTLTCPSSTADTVTQFAPGNALPASYTALAANMTISFASCTAGQKIGVIVKQAASGGPYTVSGLPSGSPQVSPNASTVTTYILHATGATTVAFDNVAADSGASVITEIAAPSADPSAGVGYIWDDSTNHVLSFENPSGTISNTSIPQTCSTNQAFTAMSAAGAYTCAAISGAPSGSAGGDLGSTYPNPTVTNGSHITNSSIPNSGLVNPATTVNGTACTLGSTCKPGTNTIGVSSPALDLLCAHGSDTTVAQLTITGATNAAPPVFTVSTSPLTAGYLVGQTFTVIGVTPSAYNATYTVGALSGTTVTASGSAPGSAYVSGGTAYMPCNNSSDGTSATNFSTLAAIPGGTFGTNVTLHVDALVAAWNSGASGVSTATFANANPSMAYGATTIFSSSAPSFASAFFFFPQAGASYISSSVAQWLSFLVHSPAAGTIYAGTLNPTESGGWNGTVPTVTSTASNQNLAVGIQFASQGLKSGTYTSGITAVGSATQTCTLTSIGSVTGATATVALTGTNTIAGGTAIVVTNTGQGSDSVSAPTTATIGSGTATCTGSSATLSTILGGSQGAAMRLLSLRVWQQ